MEPELVWIVCPCFFDVPSFLRLRDDARVAIEQVLPGAQLRFALIDDTAGQDPAIEGLGALDDVLVVAPPYNLGHQGGLVFALRGLRSRIAATDLVVTMDSDGEDRPGDLGELLAPLLRAGRSERLVCVALRTRRHETPLFKAFYACFKLLFRTLTGVIIRNGNYAAFRGWLLRDVIHHPHFDQCYSSSFISLPLPVVPVPLPRGTRYAGQSRMGYLGLFTHGIRMLMPFSERIATRGMVASGATVALSGAAFVVSLFVGASVVVPLLFGLYGVVGIGFSYVLFATFSQSKSRSLRGLVERDDEARAPVSRKIGA